MIEILDWIHTHTDTSIGIAIVAFIFMHDFWKFLSYTLRGHPVQVIHESSKK